MSRALFTAATGMIAQERKIDVVANNLANANTTGFQQGRAEFKDLMYQTLRHAGPQGAGDRIVPTNVQVGLGAQLQSVTRNFEQGNAQVTDDPLDMMISGDGFFMVRDDNDVVRLTRNGAFKLDDDGRLVNSEGYQVEPGITFPSGTSDVEVGSDGRVYAYVGDDNRMEVGQLEIAMVVNRDSLETMGGNLYRVRDFDTNVSVGVAREEGRGSITGRALEASNVEVVDEMIAMISGQRAYEANSKVIQTADSMMEQANNLR